MISENSRPTDINITFMESVIEEALMILGKDWFDRQLNKDRQAREATKIKNHNRQRIRYSAPHMLIQWHVEYKEWHVAYIQHNDTSLNQSALLLTSFASNLVKAKNAIGLGHILPRLRIPEEFLAASFEVEVLTGYLNKGWKAEFVETKTERSPDLKITTNEGKVFWAECKYRNEMTGRDMQVRKFWDQLQDTLYRTWGPAKINVAISIRTTCDPIHTELQSITDAILQATQAMVNHPERTRLEIRWKSQNEKYEFNLRYLTDPDEEQPIKGFQNLGDDWFTVLAEFMADEKGNMIARNPKIFKFTNMNPPDRYKGVLNSFNSAVGQLPESEPGVIWIRIPYPTDDSRAQEDLNTMAAKL